GGLIVTRNISLLEYIAFAYKMTDGQLAAFRAMAPSWVLDDRFDIQARTDREDVTKDQLRLMMRSLLAERFNLSVHYETRRTRAFALLEVRPGSTGPRLRVHPADSPCATTLPKKNTPEATAEGFPTTCGGIVGLPARNPRDYEIGGSGIGIALLANSLAGWGALGRPVIDKTGLQGNYDFTLEFAPEPSPGQAAPAGDSLDFAGPSFREALKQQLGLKIESKEVEVQVLVLDHIDRLIPN
ncbi:MAG: TIGR03435 family protein, partial [Terriglobia bacterium]